MLEESVRYGGERRVWGAGGDGQIASRLAPAAGLCSTYPWAGNKVAMAMAMEEVEAVEVGHQTPRPMPPSFNQLYLHLHRLGASASASFLTSGLDPRRLSFLPPDGFFSVSLSCALAYRPSSAIMA